MLLVVIHEKFFKGDGSLEGHKCHEIVFYFLMLKKGASITNIVIILSSWAVIKIPMLANEVKFLGIKFMGIRWVLTVISIFTMGYFMALFVKKEICLNQKWKVKKEYSQ